MDNYNLDIRNQLFDEIKQYFSQANGSHDFEHVKRVYKLSMSIGEKENTDTKILGCAALLHDIGRIYESRDGEYRCHAQIGGEQAPAILEKYDFKQDEIRQIVHCIETHRFRRERVPETTEAKVLFDADKLDSIGAIGLGRAFVFSGEIGAKVHNNDIDPTDFQAYSKEDTAYREYLVKLSKIKNLMLTEEGGKLAQDRHDFMVRFFDRLRQEVEGFL